MTFHVNKLTWWKSDLTQSQYLALFDMFNEFCSIWDVNSERHHQFRHLALFNDQPNTKVAHEVYAGLMKSNTPNKSDLSNMTYPLFLDTCLCDSESNSKSLSDNETGFEKRKSDLISQGSPPVPYSFLSIKLWFPTSWKVGSLGKHGSRLEFTLGLPSPMTPLASHRTHTPAHSRVHVSINRHVSADTHTLTRSCRRRRGETFCPGGSRHTSWLQTAHCKRPLHMTVMPLRPPL